MRKKTGRDAADVARIVYAALCDEQRVDVCDMNMRVVMHDMPADSQCRSEEGGDMNELIGYMRCL